MKIQEKHVAEMNEKYKDLILESIENTRFYDDELIEIKKVKTKESPKVSLVSMDTVSAIFRYAIGHKKICALNFASFTHAGGGYMLGDHAQEESLCAASTLYNVLSHFEDYYEYNREHRNGGLYMNRALYSPNIVFKSESKKAKCDILTCAAPNNNAFFGNAADNKKALKNRIKFILNIIREEHPDTIILGAWGCGAFSQNPKVVANYFYDLIEEYIPEDIEVIFAIPNSYNGNYGVFMEEMLK